MFEVLCTVIQKEMLCACALRTSQQLMHITTLPCESLMSKHTAQKQQQQPFYGPLS